MRNQRSAQAARLAEKFPRLRPRESGKTGCFVIGRDSIGTFDRFDDIVRKLSRQAEPDRDGGGPLGLEGTMFERQRRLERADQVADDVFGRVMDERREPEVAAELGLELGGDAFDEKTVLRHRESMRAARL